MLHVAGIAQRHELLVGIVISAIALCPLLFLVCLLSQWRVVACRLQHTDLVLYLHHDDHLTLRVFLADMSHECRKGLQIGLQHIVAETRGNLHLFSLGGHRPREPLRVLLEPTRRIARHRVLPRAKPKEHHVQLLTSRHVDSTVNECEVELPLYRFDELPVSWHKYRIQSQCPHPWQHFIDIFYRRRSRVAQLSAKNGII